MRIEGRGLAGAILIVLGLIFLLDNIVPGFRFWHFLWDLWPVSLIALGIYIVLREGRFKHKGSLRRSLTNSKFIGDLNMSFRGREIGDVDVSIFMGDLAIDLNDAKLRPGLNTIDVSFGFGEVSVNAPQDFPIRVMAREIAGELKCGQQKSDGLFPKLDYSDEDYGTSHDKLRINVRGLFGELTVQKLSV